jgi:DNA-binding ferritin-like protein
LLSAEQSEEFRARWEAVQSTFVDQPRESVEKADALVTDVIRRLTEIFQQTRESLETQLSEADDVSTEDLRIGLQRYRSFFKRLLSA